MSSYGYESALKAAGAVVHDYQSFGSYQGDWLAYVTYNGESGWVRGSYGSCSYCDSFDAEFQNSYLDDEESKGDMQRRLADFGRSYLDVPMYTTKELIDGFKEQAEWDSNAQDIVEFLTSHIQPDKFLTI